MAEPRRPPRAEVVGSLLRPLSLMRAIEQIYEAGHHALLAEERAKDFSRLRAVEDELIASAVARQIGLGLDVVSDGEYRRWMFTNSFYDAVDGVTTDNPIEFTNTGGETVVLSVHAVKERLRLIDSPGAREARYLASVTSHPFKITFPAASLFAHPFGLAPEAYDTLADYVSHATELERILVREAVSAGCRYVQLDFALYPYLVDRNWIRRFAAAGHTFTGLLDAAIAADKAVVDGLPAEVTRGLHICRGNYRSSWLCDGGLEPVAERMFSELPYDTFLVEWDDVERDGGYAPLRFVPPGKIVVMGLISSKTAALEAEDDVLRELEAASRYLPVEQLAISPQCGFASVVDGNELDEDAQWRKLELVCRVADRVWPR